MAFDAGAITSTLGLDISPFTQGMLQAEGIAQLFPSVVTNFLANPLLGVIDIAKRAGNALLSLFTDATNNADSVGDMAAQVGVGVEQLSGLALVAEQAGSGLFAVTDAYKFLGRAQVEYVAGEASAREAFDRLAVRPVDAAGGLRPLAELMLEVADALAALPEGGRRTQAAMELLGRSGTELIPTLSQGSAEIRRQIALFERYGAVITADAVTSADRWIDAMGEMRIAWRGLQNQLAEPLRDALLPYLMELLEWIRTHPEEIRQELGELAIGIAEGLKTAAEAVKDLAPHLGSLAALLGAGALGGSIASALVLVWDLVHALRWLRTGWLDAGAAASSAAGEIGTAANAAGGAAGGFGGRLGRGAALGALAGFGTAAAADALGAGSQTSSWGGAGVGVGLTIGSIFGPLGAVIGALLGGGAGLLYGASADRRAAQTRGVGGFDSSLEDLTRTSREAEPALGRLPSIFEQIDRQAAASIPNLERVDRTMGALIDRVGHPTAAAAVPAAASIDRSVHIDQVSVHVPEIDAGEITGQIAVRLRDPLLAEIRQRESQLEAAALADTVGGAL